MVRGAIYCPVHMLCVRAKWKKEAEAGKRTLMLDCLIPLLADVKPNTYRTRDCSALLTKHEMESSHPLKLG